MAQYYRYDSGGGSFLNSVPPVTLNLIIVNVIVFIATLINQNFMVGTFALYFPGDPQYYTNPPMFRWWQIVTHMFMHGGIWHIFFNMYTLLVFGMVLERTLGSRKFLILYFVAGFGAVALHLGVEYLQAQHLLAAGNLKAYDELILTPTLGASGAVYGVLIGFAMLFPNAVLTLIFPPIPLKAKWWVLIFVAIELFTGVTGTAEGVAHFAHLGGMLSGFLLILYWKRSGRL